MTALMIASYSEADQRAQRELHAQLAQALANVETERQRTAAAHQQHRDDIALIGDRLIREADDRDFCTEYDTVVDELNCSLRVELPLREHDFTVTTTIELRLSITAFSQDDAIEKARELIDRAESRLDAMNDITAYPQGDYDVAEDD